MKYSSHRGPNHDLNPRASSRARATAAHATRRRVNTRARHRTTRRDATGRDGTTGERVKAREIVDASSADVDVDGATRRDANEAIIRERFASRRI